jgi:hypothetical protein
VALTKVCFYAGVNVQTNEEVAIKLVSACLLQMPIDSLGWQACNCSQTLQVVIDVILKQMAQDLYHQLDLKSSYALSMSGSIGS